MAGQPYEEGAPSSSTNAGSNNTNLQQRAAFAHGLLTPETTCTSPSPYLALRPAPEHMNDSSSKKGKNKRAADDAEDAEDTEDDYRDSNQDAIVKPDRPPQVVRRALHRRAGEIWDLNPPASALFPRTPSYQGQSFNVFKALLRHPNLFFQFALRLPPATFLDLYSIDKEFHYRANKYSISLTHDFAKHHAPEAAWVFSWQLYPDLCISDPLLKPMDDRSHLARDIPGLRWVNMVLSRERVVQEILTLLALEGHRVPAQTKGVLMKLWVVMEHASQKVREAFLADPIIWKDEDILLFQLFLMKLDMRFGNPVQGYGCSAISHLLLTQKSLLRLHAMMHDGDLDEEFDDIIIKTYLEEDLNSDDHPWLNDEALNGLAMHQFGELSFEDWDSTNDGTMDSAVDLVILEGIKRGLNIESWLLDFVTAGCVDEGGKNIPRLRKHILDLERKVSMGKEGSPKTSGPDLMGADLEIEWGCQKRPALPMLTFNAPG